MIAHEVGHHVQNLLGISTKVRQQQQGLSQVAQNRLSVKLELQADCFAGVWGHYMEKSRCWSAAIWKRRSTPPGHRRRQVAAAGSGPVVPDSFTHGTSAQRLTWFKRGFDGSKPASCDIFAAR